MPVYKSKTPTKDGKCWFFKDQVEDVFGNVKQYVSKKYSTKTEAKDEERKFLNELNGQKLKPSKMTIGDLWNDFLKYQETRVRISTQRSYRHTEKYISSLFNIKCVEFSLSQFEIWRSNLKSLDNLNTVSKNDKLKVFRTLLNYGRKKYEFDFTKILGTESRFKDPGKISQVHNVYSLEEFNQFLSAEQDFRFRCLWLTLYYCGLRIGEARGLQWKDIDWDTNTIWINKQIQSIDNYSTTWFMCDLKTKSSNRKIVMCDTLANNLKSYHEQVSQFTNFSEDFFVFGEDSGVTPITYPKARRRKNTIAKNAGVKQIRLHDFRHSCASLLIYSGVPIPEVSRYMGHASITETLRTYAHMFGSDLSNVTAILNNINSN